MLPEWVCPDVRGEVPDVGTPHIWEWGGSPTGQPRPEDVKLPKVCKGCGIVLHAYTVSGAFTPEAEEVLDILPDCESVVVRRVMRS